MRVAVVGASGNVGTALLTTLRDDPGVEVVGVVRRVPQGMAPPPYDRVRWVACDIGAAAEGPTLGILSPAFRGCDAVVHLGWQIQPSHDRARLRATNVEGSRRVVEAARAAGVRHLVVASSVGAYSPVDDDRPRTEDWATDGVASSAYSVDKVALERLLDHVQEQEPTMAVARVRPALVFQSAAASGIERYFLGPLAPAAALRRRLPALPWPRGFRLQVVHATDLAAALRAVLVGRHDGAFNVAAPQVLRGQDLAGIVAGGRSFDVPPSFVRAAVDLGWRTRALHVSPGWVDLAAGVPVMDCARAHDVLGWQPQWDGEAAAADLVAGLAAGAGTASPPMRPRSRARRSLVGGQASST